MFKKLLKKLNEDSVRKNTEFHLEISTDLSENVATIQSIVAESSDVVQRDFIITHKLNATLFYIDGMCNKEILNEDVIKPLTNFPMEKIDGLKKDEIVSYISKEYIIPPVCIFDNIDEALLPFMSGDTLLLIDGVDRLFIIGTQGFEKRAIEEPQSEVVIRGPRDGFSETIQTNMMLLRRRISDPNLILQVGELGRRSKKKFCLAYLKGVVNEDLLEEVRYRISCVDTDIVLETGTLEQLIEDNTLSPFPQLSESERPDRVAAAIANGQIAVLVDGTPFVLMAPTTFQQLFKSPEDYYSRWQIGTLLRMLRYLAAFIALFAPSLYIALSTFHQGMIPTTLVFSIAAAREGVAFPAFVEALLMEITIELLREAGIRLPRAVGQTIGIVGGIVIGEAAVRAGFVSPIMVIVVATTAIASFTLPSYSLSITLRMLRFGMMIAAAVFGIAGIILVYIFINIHLVGLRSFGSYYTSPFAPYRFVDWLDLILRAPLSVQKTRTDEPRTLDTYKQN